MPRPKQHHVKPCAETVIARFSDRPDDHVATHMGHLNAFSDGRLSAASRRSGVQARVRPSDSSGAAAEKLIPLLADKVL